MTDSYEEDELELEAMDVHQLGGTEQQELSSSSPIKDDQGRDHQTSSVEDAMMLFDENAINPVEYDGMEEEQHHHLVGGAGDDSKREAQEERGERVIKTSPTTTSFNPSTPLGKLSLDQAEMMDPKDTESFSSKSVFPLSKIKAIAKLDRDISALSSEALFIVAAATEEFLARLTKEAYTSKTIAAGRKQLSYKDLASVVAEMDHLDFLRDLIPMPVCMNKAREMSSKIKQKASSSSS